VRDAQAAPRESFECRECAERLPLHANYCLRCGVRQTAAPPPEQSGSECEIVWWQGYVKGAFVAVRKLPSGSAEVAMSRLVWAWRSRGAVDDEAARAAHAELVARLSDAGWEPVGEAEPWWALRFGMLPPQRATAPRPSDLAVRTRHESTPAHRPAPPPPPPRPPARASSRDRQRVRAPAQRTSAALTTT
jgi:hypothetical protein